MTSYLRNLFGGQSQPSKSHGESRSRSRPPPTTHKSSRLATSEYTPSRSAGVKRSYSATRSHVPSPLQDVTNDGSLRPGLQRSNTSRSQSKSRGTSSGHRRPSNAQYSGSGSGPHYQFVSPSEPYMNTPTSSRTGSSASLHPGTPSVAYLQPLSRSASHSHASKMPSRPALKSNNTWTGTGTTSSVGRSSSHTRSHVTFHHPSSLHMHPLFAYSRLHHAPIQYDVGRTPSARTVLDCTTHSPVPAHTLAQPATDPPTAAPDQLVLRSHKFPWTIVVKASSPSPSNKKIKRSNSRSSVAGTIITNLDVLYAIHTTLLARVTPEEWEALGNGSKAQRKVTRAYEKRCSVMGGWEGGVRRIDWLGGKTHLTGIEVDRSSGNGVGKLVFARIC